MQRNYNRSFAYENALKARFSSDFFKSLPQCPGVYFMVDEKNSILYIGKAKNLKKRIQSYSLLKPGQSADHILEMIEYVRAIRWRECKTEKAALAQEIELLHAVRPPFNILHADAENYLFIGIQENKKPNGCLEETASLTFQLSSRESIQAEGFKIYGCFKQRRKVKDGYAALLRLIYAATHHKPRFSYPSKLTRISPPWLYSLHCPKSWLNELDRFLCGNSKEFLRSLVFQLLDNEMIPEFMRPSIQEDIELLKKFYRTGPLFTYKKGKKIRSRVLTHSQMDDLITQEFGELPFEKTA